jgi:ribosomal protein S18 acetylase RimI-like enzyme
MARWNDRLGDLVEDWKEDFRRNSLPPAVLKVGKELLQLPYRHIQYFMIARFLLEPLPEVPATELFTIRKFEAVDLPAVVEINCPSEARQLARRLASGHIGVTAYFKNSLVGYAWACKKVDPSLDRIQLDLAPHEFLCIDAYTAPTHRQMSVQTRLIIERLRIFRELGYRKAFCYIEKSNKASLRAWNKVGGTIVGEIDYFRIGSRRWVHFKVNAESEVLQDQRRSIGALAMEKKIKK